MKDYKQGKKDMKLKPLSLNSQSAFPMSKPKMNKTKGHSSKSFSLSKYNRGANG